MKLYSIPKIVLTNNDIEEGKIVYIDREQADIIFNRYRTYKNKNNEDYVHVRYHYMITLPYKDHYIHSKNDLLFSNVIPKKDVCVYTALSNDFYNKFGDYNWKFDKKRLFLRFVKLDKGVLNIYFVYYISGNEQIDSDFKYEISTHEEVIEKFSDEQIKMLIEVV